MTTQNLSLPILDPAAIEEIRSLDDSDCDVLVNEVVKAYLDSSPALIEQLRQGMTQCDAAKVRIAAHTLKSSSANVGAARLQELCRGTEHAARDGDLSGGADAVACVERCYHQTSAALADMLRQPEDA